MFNYQNQDDDNQIVELRNQKSLPEVVKILALMVVLFIFWAWFFGFGEVSSALGELYAGKKMTVTSDGVSDSLQGDPFSNVYALAKTHIGPLQQSLRKAGEGCARRADHDAASDAQAVKIIGQVFARSATFATYFRKGPVVKEKLLDLTQKSLVEELNYSAKSNNEELQMSLGASNISFEQVASCVVEASFEDLTKQGLIR